MIKIEEEKEKTDFIAFSNEKIKGESKPNEKKNSKIKLVDLKQELEKQSLIPSSIAEKYGINMKRKGNKINIPDENHKKIKKIKIGHTFDALKELDVEQISDEEDHQIKEKYQNFSNKAKSKIYLKFLQ